MSPTKFYISVPAPPASLQVLGHSSSSPLMEWRTTADSATLAATLVRHQSLERIQHQISVISPSPDRQRRATAPLPEHRTRSPLTIARCLGAGLGVGSTVALREQRRLPSAANATPLEQRAQSPQPVELWATANRACSPSSVSLLPAQSSAHAAYRRALATNDVVKLQQARSPSPVSLLPAQSSAHAAYRMAPATNDVVKLHQARSPSPVSFLSAQSSAHVAYRRAPATKNVVKLQQALKASEAEVAALMAEMAGKNTQLARVQDQLKDSSKSCGEGGTPKAPVMVAEALLKAKQSIANMLEAQKGLAKWSSSQAAEQVRDLQPPQDLVQLVVERVAMASVELSQVVDLLDEWTAASDGLAAAPAEALPSPKPSAAVSSLELEEGMRLLQSVAGESTEIPENEGTATEAKAHNLVAAMGQTQALIDSLWAVHSRCGGQGPAAAAASSTAERMSGTLQKTKDKLLECGAQVWANSLAHREQQHQDAGQRQGRGGDGDG